MDLVGSCLTSLFYHSQFHFATNGALLSINTFHSIVWPVLLLPVVLPMATTDAERPSDDAVVAAPQLDVGSAVADRSTSPDTCAPRSLDEQTDSALTNSAATAAPGLSSRLAPGKAAGVLSTTTDASLRWSGCVLTSLNLLVAARGLLVLFAMLAASLHRRHLMVWGLFAPKVFFEVFLGAVTDAAAVSFGALVLALA